MRACHAVVADLRVTHRNHLPAIRRIGAYFEITGHRGVEDDLSVGLNLGAEVLTQEDSPALEDKGGHSCHASAPYTVSPPTRVARTRPRSDQPASGVFLPLDRNLVGSTIQVSSGSKTTKSAGEPAERRPKGSWKTRAGPIVNRCTSGSSESLP